MEKIYYNSKLAKFILGLSSCHTIMWFGNIYSKRTILSESSINHEKIHCRQYFEHTVIGLILASIVILFFASNEWNNWCLLSIPVAICFYYILYCVEWIFDLICQTIHGIIHPANFKEIFYSTYRYCLFFEQEAYDNQYNFHYLNNRKLLSCYKYIGKIIHCKNKNTKL